MQEGSTCSQHMSQHIEMALPTRHSPDTSLHGSRSLDRVGVPIRRQRTTLTLGACTVMENSCHGVTPLTRPGSPPPMYPGPGEIRSETALPNTAGYRSTCDSHE
ncbi:uncharacterized protein BCR38DRAFT_447317 [Pseudomassariella vexata]|uniref:Uncharacterized protein n=1 Tax=Pseudomassariella vexata TaxID=1141098 RepID=A0A1Y2DGQ6_9PEZI|nr:uncharacterized protein BCR38DRAFT_447317 [Pseudomassariella vexata]ORY58438.1 hypothetical protein BCR38DRAFT_447317 [Pseudomassariella vexata]